MQNAPKIPVVIPAYQPDANLLRLLNELHSRFINLYIAPIVLINDGSGQDYDIVFSSCRSFCHVIIGHKSNRGKGEALKSGFRYVLNNMPDALGAVTADADGQHNPASIKVVMEEFMVHPDKLILGTRSFDKKIHIKNNKNNKGGNKDGNRDSNNIPLRSKIGNIVTQKVLSCVTADKSTPPLIYDTQTGLRGYPLWLMKECLQFTEHGFDFEMRVLLTALNRELVSSVHIETIYVENHNSHFRPLYDSFKIYFVLLNQLLRFTAVSLISFAVDITIFKLTTLAMSKFPFGVYIPISTVMARLVSIFCKYKIRIYGFQDN